MSLTTKLIGWAMKLPPAMHSDLRCEVDLRVPMPGGTVLLANRTAPSDQVIVLGDVSEMKRHCSWLYWQLMQVLFRITPIRRLGRGLRYHFGHPDA